MPNIYLLYGCGQCTKNNLTELHLTESIRKKKKITSDIKKHHAKVAANGHTTDQEPVGCVSWK